MEYTQEQYQTAINNALAAGDREAAERMARKAASLYGPAKTAPAKTAPAQSAPAQSAPAQAPAPTTRELFAKELDGFVPKVEERFSRIAGENPSIAEQVYRAPEKAMIGVSQAARSAGTVIGSAISDMIPNFVKEGAEEMFNSVKQTDSFKKAMDVASMGIELYDAWAKDNPAEAERFESSIDVGTLFSPRPDLKRLVDKTTGKVEDVVFKDTKEGVTELLKPEVFSAEDVVEEVGMLRKQKWMPTPRELETIEQVSKIEGVDPSRSYTYNYRVLQKDIAASSKKVDNMVNAQNKPMQAVEVKERIGSTISGLQKDPAFLAAPAEAKKAAEQYSALAMGLIQEYGSDLNGVLKARRQFDSEVNKMSKKLLGAEAATGKALVVKAIRTEMNDILKENTSGDKLHDLLARQHHSFNALESMSNKRAKEQSNALNRLTSRVTEVANLPKSPLALAATGTAVAHLFGGPMAAMAAGTAGLGAYGFFQTVKPVPRAKVLAAMINAVDKTIGKTKDPNLLNELKADRVVLVGYLEQTRDEAKEETKK